MAWEWRALTFQWYDVRSETSYVLPPSLIGADTQKFHYLTFASKLAKLRVHYTIGRLVETAACLHTPVTLQATEQGIWVSNIPSSGTGNALSCAEHAIYLMLATLRQQNAMQQSIQQRRVGVPVSETLFGKSVLLVGFGNIAKELIPRQESSPAMSFTRCHHEPISYWNCCRFFRRQTVLLIDMDT